MSQNSKHNPKKIVAAGLIAILLLTIIYFVGGRRPQYPWRDVPDPGEEEFQSAMDGVKDVHIYIFCNVIRSEKNIPSTIQPDALGQLAAQEVKNKYYPMIKFSWEIVHEPVVTTYCGQTTQISGWKEFNDPGNLNFVATLFFFKQQVDGKNVPFAMLSKIFYRTEQIKKRNTVKLITDAVLDTHPLDLNNPQTNQRFDQYGWSFIY